MKFFKHLTALMLVLFAVVQLSAADYEFRVLASKGKNTVKQNGKTVKISVGTKVNQNDVITVSGKFLGLVHSSGKTLDLKKAGTYNVADLTKQVSSKKSNIAGKFADFVMANIDDGAMLDSKGGKHGTGGATERSLNFDEIFSMMNGGNITKLFPNSPKKMNVIGGKVTFNWFKAKGTEKYIFHLTDRFDSPVYTKVVSDTSITLDVKEAKIAKDEYYFWKVTLESNPKVESESACFLVLSNAQIDNIKDTVEMIRQETDCDNNATGKVILAAFYEQNLLYDEAIRAYQQAMKMEPEVDTYKKIYDNFLNRNSLAASH